MARVSGRFKVFAALAAGLALIMALACSGEVQTVEVIKEVPVEKVVTKEVIKEVPVEKVVTQEVVKEVPKEVIKTVEVEKPVEIVKEVVKVVEVDRPVEVVKTEVVEKVVTETVQLVVTPTPEIMVIQAVPAPQPKGGAEQAGIITIAINDVPPRSRGLVRTQLSDGFHYWGRRRSHHEDRRGRRHRPDARH